MEYGEARYRMYAELPAVVLETGLSPAETMAYVLVNYPGMGATEAIPYYEEMPACMKSRPNIPT